MGWKNKFVFLLVVYFAGFATAVYCLAPVPEGKAYSGFGQKSFASSALKSDEFAKSFNIQMHKAFAWAKGAAVHTGKVMKQKLDDRHGKS